MNDDHTETSHENGELPLVRHSEYSERWISAGIVLLLPLTIAFVRAEEQA